jgi:hypothetical protein
LSSSTQWACWFDLASTSIGRIRTGPSSPSTVRMAVSLTPRDRANPLHAGRDRMDVRKDRITASVGAIMLWFRRSTTFSRTRQACPPSAPARPTASLAASELLSRDGPSP